MGKAAALVIFLGMACAKNGSGPAPVDMAATAVGEEVAQEETAEAAPEQRFGDLGTVDFPTSCTAEAQPHLDIGLALLHHMTYEAAREEFAAARETDPDCAMANWGVAMTYIHPLWPDVPTEEQLEQGNQLVTEARAGGVETPREAAYLETVEAYYRDAADRDEASRLADFRAAWQRVAQAYPDDLEAATFYALAHLATADVNDKTYRIQREAGALAEAVLAQEPHHPGAHHYIIHAYDVPELAHKAVDVARSYGDLAPNVPHSLHMPSHIFVRLGMWRDAIEWNVRSAKAALKERVDGAISLHYFHAMDYVIYGYLQIADDGDALAVVRQVKAMEPPFQQHGVTAYALAAIPARHALERHAWREAVALPVRDPASFNWDQAPEYEALTHFARALGAAHINDVATARQSIAAIERLHEKVAPTSEYWARQIEVQKKSAQAWLTYRQNARERGLELMREAAALEATTDKNPITPSELLPASELLGDMLLDMGQYNEAIAAYEMALERSPRRFNSLFGAGMAAERSGDREQARNYYQTLSEMAVEDGTREELIHARTFLERTGTTASAALTP